MKPKSTSFSRKIVPTSRARRGKGGQPALKSNVPFESSSKSCKDNKSEDWQHRCTELLQELDRLRLQVIRVESERDQYLKALYALTREDFDFDKKAILANIGKAKPLQELIAELEAQGA